MFCCCAKLNCSTNLYLPEKQAKVIRVHILFSSITKPFNVTYRAYSAASVSHLAPAVQKYVLEKAELCQPDQIVVCDGSDEGIFSLEKEFRTLDLEI